MVGSAVGSAWSYLLITESPFSSPLSRMVLHSLNVTVMNVLHAVVLHTYAVRNLRTREPRFLIYHTLWGIA